MRYVRQNPRNISRSGVDAFPFENRGCLNKPKKFRLDSQLQSGAVQAWVYRLRLEASSNRRYACGKRVSEYPDVVFFVRLQLSSTRENEKPVHRLVEEVWT